MRNLSERLRLPKGKSLFISAAIATLLVQPFYMSLSSNTAFAATEPNLTPLQADANENYSAPITRIEQPVKTEINEAGNIRSLLDVTVTLEDKDTQRLISQVSHSVSVQVPGGSTPLNKSNPTADKSSNGGIFTYRFSVDTGEYGDGSYIISYNPTYRIGEDKTDYSIPDEDKTVEVEVNDKRPTAALNSPTNLDESTITTDNLMIEVNASSPNEAEHVTQTEATLHRIDGSQDVQTFRVEGSTLIETFSGLTDGQYRLDYKSYTATKQSITYSVSFAVAITTPDPDEEEDSEDGNGDDNTEEEEQNQLPGDSDDTDLVTPPTVTEPEDAPVPEDDDESEDDEDSEDTENLVLGAATFSTGLVGNADPFFTEIIGGPTIPLGNNSQDSEDDGSTSSTSTNTAEVDERGVVQFLGISWYWWVAMLAGAASIWSLVIAGRNRMTDGSA